MLFYCCIIFQCVNRWTRATTTRGFMIPGAHTLSTASGCYTHAFVPGVFIYIRTYIQMHETAESCNMQITTVSRCFQTVFQSSADDLGSRHYCTRTLIARHLHMGYVCLVVSAVLRVCGLNLLFPVGCEARCPSICI